MIFYSRENGRDGEKDYIDTDDFKDVYFEKESFFYIKDGSQFKTEINFELVYEPGSNAVLFKGTLKDDNFQLSESKEIDPVALVEQGAIAYYEEELLDNIEVIKAIKEDILSSLKTQLLEKDCLLKGTSLDVLGLINNMGNTIATFDNVTIVDNNKITASKFYSIVNIDTIMAGTVTVFLSDEKKITGEVNSISTSNNQIEIHINNMQTKDNDEIIEYKRSKDFNDIEEYYEDRAQYISIESTTEADFDEFDDLF